MLGSKGWIWFKLHSLGKRPAPTGGAFGVREGGYRVRFDVGVWYWWLWRGKSGVGARVKSVNSAVKNEGVPPYG